MTPKYLKEFTVSISSSPIFIYPEQLINIAFVLPMLIFSKLSTQKVYRRCNSAYSSSGEGASNTRSSAYASMNIYKAAIV